MQKKAATILGGYYGKTLSERGPTLAGVDWLKEEDALLRYQLHLQGLTSVGAKSVLDVGCGLGHFFEYIKNLGQFDELCQNYFGVDVLPEMIEHARKKFPETRFAVGDAEEIKNIGSFDFSLANGLFTVKSELSDEQMWQFIEKTLDLMWSCSNLGMSFNLMSDFVEHRYERLFYINPGELINRLVPKFGRRFLVLANTKLYDVCYVWIKA